MRKILCIVFIILICLQITYVYAENETDSTNQTDLQTQQSDLKNEINESNQKL